MPSERFVSLNSSGIQAKAMHSLASASACDPPKITLQRDGDRITQIKIECSCGQVIELSCTY
jgi:hypothetical protein